MKKIIKSFVLCLIFTLLFPLVTNAGIVATPGNSQQIQLLQPIIQPASLKNAPVVKPTVNKANSQTAPLLQATIKPSSLLRSNTNSQKIPVGNGCTAISKYSVTTGKLCTKTLISECAFGHLFSFITGKRCTNQ